MNLLAPALFALSVAAGACIAVQGPVNGLLARGVGSPIAAALISFAAGLVALAAVFLALVGPAGIAAGWRNLPVWVFVLGGPLGAAYITIAAFAVPRLGVTTYLTLVIAGQLLAGLVLDHLGAFGMLQQPVSLGRLLAAALVIAGVVLTRLT